VRKEPPFEPAQEGDNDELEEMMTLVEMERDEARRRPVEAEDGPPLVEEEDEWEGLYD